MPIRDIDFWWRIVLRPPDIIAVGVMAAGDTYSSMAIKSRAMFFAICLAVLVTVSFMLINMPQGSSLPAKPGLANKTSRNLQFAIPETSPPATTHNDSSTPRSRSSEQNRKCPDILKGMSKGQWLTRPLTDFEQMSMDVYLQTERSAFRIPPTFQRLDGKCGNNLTYEQTPQYKHMWFKSICNPKGSTPCCKDDRCEDLPVEECRCLNCFDERQVIYPEFSTWQPEDESCTQTTFTAKEACRLLEGASIHVAGDSFVREMYIALAILLAGDDVAGALRKDLTVCKKIFMIFFQTIKRANQF
ncbi:hypothetical protein ElyMa_006665000 [Elysia marginata]|uniref:Uncharacterized protein n=1 Tax=Elysia marginata TaxID=1093978 RepID=A0AAV4ILE3_9GAST|nr:hypothetical protein ElyMa_006665000 [Elysia marginata]